MNINWYPGHMFKTKKEIKNMINLVDLVIEIRDARAVISTTNPDIGTLTKDKPKMIVLSKVDLADNNITNRWIDHYKKQGIPCIGIDIIRNKNIKIINDQIKSIMKTKLERYKSKGVKNYTLRGMILGIPNVGKSSLINKISNNKIAKVGNRPGVTKSNQWIKTKWDIDLLDTPGILWPKFDSSDVGLNLVYIGSIKDEILDIQDVCYNMLGYLLKNYRMNLVNTYKVELSDDVSESLDILGKKLGCLSKGFSIDYDRLAHIVIGDFRSGKIGNISLERPEDLLKEE